ncbi:FkbM family methyltransferase [Bradyrhizobium sp. 177]|nr:FkbM family methyltransferase [Bradyrhizobium sp. 177]
MARGLTAGWGYQPHLLAHFPVPDLIKMDIEGAETRAFAGASRLLSERRTAIFLALHDHALEEAPAILRRHNFSCSKSQRGRRGPRLTRRRQADLSMS